MPEYKSGTVDGGAGGGQGGTMVQERGETTTSNPLAPEAIKTQVGEQQGYTSSYTDLINQALNMYKPTAQQETKAAVAPVLGQTMTTYRDNRTGETIRALSGSDEDNRLFYWGNQNGTYTVTGRNVENVVTPGQAAEYATIANPNTSYQALQGAYNALGTASSQYGNPAYLQGPGSAAGGDVVQGQNFQPYIQQGGAAMNQLASMSGLGQNPMSSQQMYEQYLNNPATQLQMQQGNNAINSNFGAKGLTGSSAIMKALNTFGQGVASQNIGAAQDNLFRMAGLGASSANQYASQLLGNYNTNVNAQQAGQVNAINAANSAGNLANTAMGQQSNLLAQLGANNAQLNTQASLARMSALANSRTEGTSYNNSITSKIPISDKDFGMTMAMQLGGIAAGLISTGGALPLPLPL